MVYKNFRILCTLRVLLLCGLALALFLVWFQTTFSTLAILIGILIIQQTISLIRYVEKSNRDLTRFVEAIKYEDLSQSFDGKGKGASFDKLNKAFSDVAREIRQARSEKEEQNRYLQTVIQHVGAGLISFQQDGEVQLINTAAKKIIGLPQVKNIQTLKGFSPELVETLFNLRAGERALVSVDTEEQRLQIALNATQFIMRGTKFTLVSLQNIESELERERMSRELEIAHQVQMSLLPKESPKLSGFDIAGLCIPAEEVGGDYYDFIHLRDNKLGIAVGDVSGKGVPAAIYMTLTKGVIQSHAEEMASPREVLSKINSFMYQSIERKAFISMFYTVLDTKARKVICSRAGHNPGMHFKNGKGDFSWIEPSGIALGLEEGDVFSDVIHEQEIDLEPGDLLVFHTDGFNEAMNKHNDEYGEERLLDIIQKNKNKTSRELIDAVKHDVHTFTESHPQHDDMTMVTVKVK